MDAARERILKGSGVLINNWVLMEDVALPNSNRNIDVSSSNILPQLDTMASNTIQEYQLEVERAQREAEEEERKQEEKVELWMRGVEAGLRIEFDFSEQGRDLSLGFRD